MCEETAKFVLVLELQKTFENRGSVPNLGVVVGRCTSWGCATPSEIGGHQTENQTAVGAELGLRDGVGLGNKNPL